MEHAVQALWRFGALAVAFTLLMAIGHVAHGQETELKPGSWAKAHYFCRTVEAAHDMAILIQGEAKGEIDVRDMNAAGDGNIIHGRCIFIPDGAGFTAKEQVAAPDVDDEIWAVTLDEDGSTWYMLHGVPHKEG
jgi:hypothetical protein